MAKARTKKAKKIKSVVGWIGVNDWPRDPVVVRTTPAGRNTLGMVYGSENLIRVRIVPLKPTRTKARR